MSQQQIERAARQQKADDPAPVEPKPQERAATLSADTADLLEDIDELLAELPQDLAQKFVQRGGE